jgi:hypothetical protein
VRHCACAHLFPRLAGAEGAAPVAEPNQSGPPGAVALRETGHTAVRAAAERSTARRSPLGRARRCSPRSP